MSTHASFFPASGDGLVEMRDDLMRLVTTRRLDWSLPIGRALREASARFSAEFTAAEWAQIPWYGPLEEHMSADVSDLHLNGPDSEIVVERGSASIVTGRPIHGEWIIFIQRQCAARSGAVRPTNEASIDDWRDDNGKPTHMLVGACDRRIRFAMVRPPLAANGPAVTARRIPERWRTMSDLTNTEVGMLPRDAASLILHALRNEVTLLISGMTGAGKTTLAAALQQAIDHEQRMIIIEEARELPSPSNGFCMEITRSGSTFREAVALSMRLRPDRVIVGEVRRDEALTMLEAMTTGHPGISTIHAPDTHTALKNLELKACRGGDCTPAIAYRMIANRAAPLLVIQVGRVASRRRVTAISEVQVQGGGNLERYTLNDLYLWDDNKQQLAWHSHPVGEWRGNYQRGEGIIQ